MYYCSVEDITTSLEEAPTGRDHARIRAAIDGASTDVDMASGLTVGSFRPQAATKYFRWPDSQTSDYYRMWLHGNPLLSVTEIVSGGVVIPEADYYLEPQEFGAPYSRIEVDLSSASALSAGNTDQRAIAVTGLWGVGDEQDAAGTLVGEINDTATSITTSDGSLIDVCDLLKIGGERMTVTQRTWVAVTGGDTADPLTASAAARSLTVDSGALYHPGELLLLEAERLRVLEVAGDVLTVARAQDGSVLASHAADLTVYASRQFSVVRAVAGSTATVHANAAAITRHVVPRAARDLAIASAVTTLLARYRGYAQSAAPAGSGQSAAPASLDELRERVRTLYGRPVRCQAV